MNRSRFFIVMAVAAILGSACAQSNETATTAPPTGTRTSPAAAPISATPAASGLPMAGGPDAISPAFFAMNTVDPDDYPKLQFGTLPHPKIGAWAWIEKTKGTFDFTVFDQYVADAAAHGLLDASTNTVSVSVTLGETPPWAASDQKSCITTSGARWCASPPSSFQDWSDFVTAIVRHYDGTTQPHIRYYELWNEMNIPVFWTGSQADMLRLAKAAYPIVHGDSHSMLLTPSVAGPVGNVAKDSGVTWMASYLDAGGAQFADGGAFHGYIADTDVEPYPFPDQDYTSGCKEFVTCKGSIVTKTNQLRQVFDQHGMKGKPMFDTEGSWGDEYAGSDEEQAAWIAQWYVLQAGLHVPDDLQFAAWFTWGKPTSFHWGTIETADGAPTQAGRAFNQTYEWLVGAVIKQPCAIDSNSVWTCALTRPGGYHAQVVWSGQGTQSYTPSAEFARLRDLAGTSTPLEKGKAISVGVSPILLEGSSKS